CRWPASSCPRSPGTRGSRWRSTTASTRCGSSRRCSSASASAPAPRCRRSPTSRVASRPRCSSPSRSRAASAPPASSSRSPGGWRERERAGYPGEQRTPRGDGVSVSEPTTTDGGAAGQMGKGVKQRDQIKMSDEEIDAFLHGKHTISLASINGDGTIHLVAMWYGFLEGELAFETKAKSQKVKNLRRNPTITCMVEERDRLLEMGKSLFERHVGPYTDDMLPAVEMMLNKRVGIKVHPVRVASWD